MFSSEAISNPTNEVARERAYSVKNDFDGDGWDDLWVAMFGHTIDRLDMNADANGDGASDYEAMRSWLDPHAELHPPQTESERIAANRVKEESRQVEQARVRDLVRPWLNKAVRDMDGKRSTIALIRAAKRARLAAGASQRAVESQKRATRIKNWVEQNAEWSELAGIENRPDDVVVLGDGVPDGTFLIKDRESMKPVTWARLSCGLAAHWESI